VIESKEDYHFYLQADRLANGIPDSKNFRDYLKNYFFPNYIWRFIRSLRRVEFYANTPSYPLKGFKKYFALRRYRKLSLKLGFSIPVNVFGPGLSIAHYGTIVVNQSARVGANCRIHVGVNIGSEAGYSDLAPVIGDNCYIGPGAKIYGNVHIPDGTAIGANAVVNQSFDELSTAIAGVPAKKIGQTNTFELLIPGSILARNGVNCNDIAGLPARKVLQYMKDKKIPLV